jgi:hypothetical protein
LARVLPRRAGDARARGGALGGPARGAPQRALPERAGGGAPFRSPAGHAGGDRPVQRRRQPPRHRENGSGDERGGRGARAHRGAGGGGGAGGAARVAGSATPGRGHPRLPGPLDRRRPLSLRGARAGRSLGRRARLHGVDAAARGLRDPAPLRAPPPSWP